MGISMTMRWRSPSFSADGKMLLHDGDNGGDIPYRAIAGKVFRQWLSEG